MMKYTHNVMCIFEAFFRFLLHTINKALIVVSEASPYSVQWPEFSLYIYIYIYILGRASFCKYSKCFYVYLNVSTCI